MFVDWYQREENAAFLKEVQTHNVVSDFGGVHLCAYLWIVWIDDETI